MERKSLLFGVATSFSLVSLNAQSKDNRPNIVLIMVDDMGYSDIGCFGGEIPTPNINKLADRGIRYTQFYNTGRSCPTRASLLTGLYPHQAGIGGMFEDPFDRSKRDNLPIAGLPENTAIIERLDKMLGQLMGECGDEGQPTEMKATEHQFRNVRGQIGEIF